jgi:serine/threonine protein kinase
MNPRIKITVGRQQGQEFEIPHQAREGHVEIGRAPFCAIQLYDMQCSGRHARFSFDGETLSVDDLNSKNGTFVNGERISEKTELNDGDELTIGSSSLVVEGLEEARAKHERERRRSRSKAAEKASEATHLVGEVMAGVQLEKIIYEGETAIVLRGTDEETGEERALKVLRPEVDVPPEKRNRFIRGHRHAAECSVRGLMKTYKAGQDGQFTYAVLELAHGRNLQKIIQKAGKPVAVAQALECTLDLLRVLQGMHEDGMVHRAVRPDNLVVDKEHNVKLTDFELVKPLPEKGEREVTRIADSGIHVTPEYSPPEMLIHAVTAGARADIFGAGACLYFMLTTHAPFPDRVPDGGVRAIFNRHYRDPSEINPKVPERVRHILATAMAGETDDRYESAEEMADDVEEALAAC